MEQVFIEMQKEKKRRDNGLMAREQVGFTDYKCEIYFNIILSLNNLRFTIIKQLT